MASDLADALQLRLSTCAAIGRVEDASDRLLYHVRLPRTGSAVMCKVMGACSARQTRNACGNAPQGASAACPAARTAFAFLGSEKLPSTNYAMCSGL